jgi:arylsulfatase A-like enzyme
VINRREFLGSAMALLSARRRPNIIVILTDDLGYADLSFQGSKDIRSPNIDRIAHGGVRFTSGLVSHPFCSPSRAGLMTGRYQQRFGHENNPIYDPANETAGLPLKELTLPQLLGSAGYATGLVGKWHLGASPRHHPLKRGFSEMFGFIGGLHDYFNADKNATGNERLIPLERNGQPVEPTGYLTDTLNREADAFVRQHRSDPFFLYLAYNAPHTPVQASEKYLDRFPNIEDKKRRTYAGMISAVDDGVGTLLATLKELKLEQDTLIFFLNDNGGPVGVNGSRNDPLRAGKLSLCEGGIRVPFAACWPGRLPAGKTFPQPVISLDILPTALAAAGIQPPPTLKLDGVNLLPYLMGQDRTTPHPRLFWRTGGGVSYAVREGRYKLVKAGDAPELYDVETDVSETRNLATVQPEVLNRLLTSFQQWNSELVPPLFPMPPVGRQR